MAFILILIINKWEQALKEAEAAGVVQIGYKEEQEDAK